LAHEKSPEPVRAPAILFCGELITDLAQERGGQYGVGFVFDADAEQRGLCFGVLAEFLHLVDYYTFFRLILFALISALGFIFLFLLASLFFLAFSKS
jgi:hypothetical protein